jgi:hypothetical protein
METPKHDTTPTFRPKGYLTRAEVAKLLSQELNTPVELYTVARWEEKGILKGQKFDMAGNRVYYQESDVNDFKEKMKLKFDNKLKKN